MQMARTTRETVHGNPGERRILAANTLVVIEPASNLPPDSPIKYWASPVEGHPWPVETEAWATNLPPSTQRSKLIASVAQTWLKKDLDGALAWAQTLPEAALAGRVDIMRRFSQGGARFSLAGLICPHAVGVQNILTPVASC